MAAEQLLTEDDRKAVESLLSVEPEGEEDGWVSLGVKDGCEQWYRADAGSKMHKFRGRIHCKGLRLADALPVVRDIEYLTRTDGMCKEAYCVERINELVSVNYSSFATPIVITDRDFVYRQVDFQTENGDWVIASRSVEHEEAPETTGHVRGTIESTGYIARADPDDPESCSIEYVVQTDPKGWIPTWVANWVAKAQAYNPAVIYKVCLEVRDEEA